MQGNRKRDRDNHNNNPVNEPPHKRQKINSASNKKRTPKNIIEYWTNKQLFGKCVVIRHGYDYQIAKF